MNINLIDLTYRTAIKHKQDYIAEVIKLPLDEKLISDGRLESWIKQAMGSGDFDAVKELITLRRPLRVGKLEGGLLAKSEINNDDFVKMIGSAIVSHADNYWNGNVV